VTPGRRGWWWIAAGLALAGALLALVVLIRANANAAAPTLAEAKAPAPPPPPPPQAPGAPPPQAAPAPVGLTPAAEPPHELKAPGGLPEEKPRSSKPKGAVKDPRDFDDEEKAAQSSLEHDTADFGKAVEILEDGSEVGRVRGRPVTPEEQDQLRQAVAKIAEVYETSYDAAVKGDLTIPGFADKMRAARDEFDKQVRSIYGLTDEQFFQIFPYRRELVPGKPQ
jgi:hypothetical protein